MEHEMGRYQFGEHAYRTGGNFESPTVPSADMYLGGNMRYQMPSNTTADHAFLYGFSSLAQNTTDRYGETYQQSNRDVKEIRRQREINKAKKEAADLDQSFILEKLAEVEPIAVTFYDKATGIEFDAEGNEISRSQVDEDINQDIQATDSQQLVNTHHWGSAYGASPFNPHSSLFNVGVYPTNPGAYPYQPMNQPVNPQINQWNGTHYPLDLTIQPDNKGNTVWSTNQSNQMITQQPIPLTAQHNFYGQIPVTATQQNNLETVPIPDYVCCSIFTAMCCCLLLGSWALYYAKTANRENQERQFLKARQSATRSCMLNVAAIIIGLACYGIIAYVTYLKVKR
ncbi:uncharacterized protein LOC131942769 isoform X2 [Physella acuta]|uniref:uncharacterized protein LOC131942769 isoform X2 n=1 Tax=Physella acuta TaxID=109671 RepID=UPI0027DD42A0|nr:uncharacterized protein LOC131942769 isoform X2 [Physella acuta]